MAEEWKQERPSWCPHISCQFKRRVQDAFCCGKLYEPQPHGADWNDARICFNCHDDGSIQNYMVNKTDVGYLRWILDALDGKKTSWLSKGASVKGGDMIKDYFKSRAALISERDAALAEAKYEKASKGMWRHRHMEASATNAKLATELAKAIKEPQTIILIDKRKKST